MRLLTSTSANFNSAATKWQSKTRHREEHTYTCLFRDQGILVCAAERRQIIITISRPGWWLVVVVLCFRSSRAGGGLVGRTAEASSGPRRPPRATRPVVTREQWAWQAVVVVVRPTTRRDHTLAAGAGCTRFRFVRSVLVDGTDGIGD